MWLVFRIGEGPLGDMDTLVGKYADESTAHEVAERISREGKSVWVASEEAMRADEERTGLETEH